MPAYNCATILRWRATGQGVPVSWAAATWLSWCSRSKSITDSSTEARAQKEDFADHLLSFSAGKMPRGKGAPPGRGILIHILDTNVISAQHRADRTTKVAVWLAAQTEADLVLSVSTRGEIERGIRLQMPQNPDYVADLRHWLDWTVTVLSDRLLRFTAESALAWGGLISAVFRADSAGSLYALSKMVHCQQAMEVSMAVAITRKDRTACELRAVAAKCKIRKRCFACWRLRWFWRVLIVQGISTRSVDDLVKAMGAGGMSKSQVSRLCAEIDERVNAFLSRPLEGA
jgi:predicted nucleic acid-binding protein